MKHLKFLGLGLVFGIVVAKAQVISWYRIYEMFLFESFHMYGVIGSAILVGIFIIQMAKRRELKTYSGKKLSLPDKKKTINRYLLGGVIFGLGWALSGACPGPMFVLLGFGYAPLLIVIAGALVGTFLYGLLRDKLPH